MEKIFVADSYKDAEILSEPYIPEGKKQPYVKIKAVCPRCGGTGQYAYNEMDGTMCYGCMGRKYVVQTVRAYTEKEYNQMQARKAREAAKKEELRQAREKDRIENANLYKAKAAEGMGFSADGYAYVVYGDDTFAIKDRLKELGGRFNPNLKWYFAKEVELPEGYKLCKIALDDVCDYEPLTRTLSFKENANEFVERQIAELVGPSTVEFYPGKEKERIRNITAKVKSIFGFDGAYGYTYVYTFASENYVFVWMTSSCKTDFEVGDTVDLTGTIKNFSEYNGVKNTYLTRCIIKPIQ